MTYRSSSSAKARVIACALLATFPAAVLAAQQAPAAPSGARSYAPSEFARFAPRTALDMVQLIPGFLIAESEDRRGLGTTSVNVLINGRATAGKTNDAVDALSRISADAVQRIEVTSSNSSQSAGIGRQIANVIFNEAERRGKGQFSWQPSVQLRDGDPAWLNGDASWGARQGGLRYSIGIRNTALRTGASGPSRLFGSNGELLDSRDEFYLERSDRPRLSGDLRYDTASGAIFNLRGSVQALRYRFRERSERSGNDLVDRTRLLTQRENDRRYELGGDADFELGPGRLKLIGLHAAESSPIDTRATTTFADNSDKVGTRFFRDADEQETALRSEYRWAAGGTDWLLSAERAITRLDNVSSLFSLEPDGSYQEVEFPGGTGDVRERRYEASIGMARRLSPQLTVQASLGAENSRLSLAADDGSNRTFTRPKGFVTLAWQASPQLRANFKVERRIGQISFFDFLASRNLLDDRENVSNPQLVPPQSWDLEAEISRDLGPLGSASLRLYGQQIEDLVDQVPVGLAGEAPGNLDTAYLYGFELKNSLFLDRLGWTGGRLDGRVQLQGSRIDDPITGESRPISNNLQRRIELSVRHDVPGTVWAWGGGLFHLRSAADFRVREMGRYRDGPLSGNIYIENKNLAGLTVRIGLSNLLSSRQDLDRFFYDGRRDSPLLSIERRRRTTGPSATLSVSGNF